MGAFVRKFADEVQRRWPDKKVMYLPYWNYTTCPEEIGSPTNLEIQMCTMSFAMMRQPGWRAATERSMRDWSAKVGGRIQTWEYPHRTIEYPGVQLQYPPLVKDYYQRNRELLTGSFLNGGSILDWSKAAPSHYCFMKILWNPDLDVDAALDVLCARMFGKAAGTARAAPVDDRPRPSRRAREPLWPAAPSAELSSNSAIFWPGEPRISPLNSMPFMPSIS